MKFSNPEERVLWERIVVGMAELEGVSSENAMSWADKIVTGYRSRRGSDTSKKPYGFSAGNGKAEK